MSRSSLLNVFLTFIVTVSLLALYRHFILNSGGLQSLRGSIATPPLEIPSLDHKNLMSNNGSSHSRVPAIQSSAGPPPRSRVRADTTTVTGDDHFATCESNYRRSMLPWSVIENVKTFVFFIGHGRSGSSIIGSMLDSHPHMIISYQSHILQEVLNKPEASDKSFIFNKIWKTSCYMTMMTRGRATYKDNKKNYTLFFDGLYQGKYNNHVDVIGDKEAGKISGMFMHDPEKFKSMLSKLREAVDIPIKVIHPIRNPFDNIATILLYEYHEHSIVEATKTKLGNSTIVIDSKRVDSNTEDYFLYYQASEEAPKMFNLDTIQIHNQDLVMHPRRTIIGLCEFLEVFCSDDYIETCSNKMFGEVSKTRYKIQWKDYQIANITKNIQKFKSLLRYDFNS